MTHDRTLGKSFGVDGERVFFYDAEGMRLTTGHCLTRESLLRKRHGWRDERDVGEAVSVIRALIRQAVKAGNRRDIAHVQLWPRLAVLLFLDGTLTTQHLENARMYERYIEIPGVCLTRGFTLQIRVMKSDKLNYAVALTDKLGRVLCKDTDPVENAEADLSV